jgi:aromatic ring hydroxylase
LANRYNKTMEDLIMERKAEYKGFRKSNGCRKRRMGF